MKLNRIQEVLNEQGVSQKELAAALDVRIATVSDMCTNKYHPRLGRLFRIAEILNVPAYTLIADYNPTKHNQEEEE